MTDSQKLDYIIRRLSTIEQAIKKRRTWITAGEVKEITGWSHSTLANKRRAGLVEFERNANGGYKYALESIPVINHLKAVV